MNNESNDFDDDFEHAVDAYEREDYKTAYKLFLPLAEQEDSDAQCYFLPLAEQEDSDAQCYLGWIYENGHGVPKDINEAVKWWKLSAEQGNAEAQHNLGMSYAKGHGVPQDYKKAEKWFRLAAERGDAYCPKSKAISPKKRRFNNPPHRPMKTYSLEGKSYPILPLYVFQVL